MERERPTKTEAPRDPLADDPQGDGEEGIDRPAGTAAGGSDTRTGGPEAPTSGDPSSAGEQPPVEGPVDPSSENPAARLEPVQRELEALNDRHLRLAAEFDNYRKRVTRERDDLGRRAGADLVSGLLDALDDLHRVAEYDAGSTTVEALLEGVELVERKLRGALEAAGLEPVDAEGQLFNPESMEALMTAPTDDPEEDDRVDQVFQKGYRFRGVLVRPARVRVKKHD